MKRAERETDSDLSNPHVLELPGAPRASPTCVGVFWQMGKAADVKEVGNLIKELDAEGINWEKHELLHTVLDAVDMIPFSQVSFRCSPGVPRVRDDMSRVPRPVEVQPVIAYR